MSRSLYCEITSVITTFEPIGYFERELKADNITISDEDVYPEAPPPRTMIDFEAQFERHESELKELCNNIEALKRNYIELYELKFVLRHTEDFLVESDFMDELMHEPHAGVAPVGVELRNLEAGMVEPEPRRRTYLR